MVHHAHTPSCCSQIVWYVNCVSTISSVARQKLAVVALGNKTIQEGDFYASLHQEQEEVKVGVEKDGEDLKLLNGITATDDHTTIISENDDVNFEDDNQTATSPNGILQQFQEFSEDITEQIRDTPIIAQAMKTFLKRYKVLTKPGGFVNARLSSALHQFGWVFGGNSYQK